MQEDMLLRPVLFAVVALVGAASGQSEKLVRLTCPDGYTVLGHSCYLVSSDTHGGADASHFCRSHNGTVAVIESQEEMNLLKKSFLNSTVHIGVNLLDIRAEIFEFVLKLSGHSGYVGFYPGEPNNFGGEDCVVADLALGFDMADVRCSESHPVLCKAPAVETSAVKTCPEDAVRFDQEWCFWAHDEYSYSWSEAVEVCRSKGLQLTSIHSQAENDFITAMVVTHPWIGLSDEAQDETYKWSDGTPLDYTNWATGQPDREDSDCVPLGTSGDWFNRNCTEMRGAVCRGRPQYEELN